jgi:hypothetical protein
MSGGVQDGQPVSAGVTNPAFIIKNADDTTPSKLGLGSTASDQGPAITWTQQQLNSILSAIGYGRNLAYNALPTWAQNFVGAVNDTYAMRIAALVALFSGSTGHTHSGTDGQGPKIAATSLANLASGNVLGNISGSTAAPSAVPVAIGPSATTIAIRDANGNSRFNNIVETLVSIASAAGTTVLTAASVAYQQLTGTTTQTFQMPVGTTLPPDWSITLINRSTGNMTINNAGSTLLQTLKTGTSALLICTDNTSSNAVWDITVFGGGSGGGGGSSLRWVEDASAPSPIQEFDNLVYLFEIGGNQFLWALVKVPSTYTAGSPVKLLLPIYNPDSTGTMLIQSVAALIRSGVDPMNTTTNQHTSSNSAITLSSGTVNIDQVLSLDLTDSAGKINSVAVSPNDLIRVVIERSVSDTAADAHRALVYGSEVTFS